MKDLQGFLGEEEEKKSRPQPKKQSAKPKERKQSKGKDDARYVSLMDEYKRMRHHDRQEANQIHNKALALRQTGDVSKDAITAGQYI